MGHEAKPIRRTPEVGVEVLQTTQERFGGRGRKSLEELVCQAFFFSEGGYQGVETGMGA
jgi:hypothetical protein